MANRFNPFNEYNQDFVNNSLDEEYDTGSLNFAAARSVEHVAFDTNPWMQFAANDGMLLQPSVGDQPKVKRKRRSPRITWKKPEGMPKRPLSAYNLFFRQEREKLLNTKQEGNKIATGIGFAGLARQIASKWKTLDVDAKNIFQSQAMDEKLRYRKEVEFWKQSRGDRKPEAGKIEEENQEHDEEAQVSQNEKSELKCNNADTLANKATLLDKTLPENYATTKLYDSIKMKSHDVKSLDVKSLDEDVMESSDSRDSMFSITGFAQRAQSDSLLELRSDIYKIRSYSGEGHQMLGQRSERVSSSLMDLVESLDEDSVSFLADLNHPDLADGSQK